MSDKPIRSLGVRACQLIHSQYQQLSLMPDVMKSQTNETIDRTIDQIRNKYGYFAVQRGIMLLDKDLSNLDAKNDHVIHPVGYLQQ